MPRRTLCRRTAPSAQAGQATVEYSALLAILAIALTVAASVAGGGALVNGVVRGLERALCIVTGGPCDAPALEACTVRSSRTGGRVGLELAVIKVGRSIAVVREERSDGSIDVSLVDTSEAAPTAGVGATAGVQTGGRRHGVGGVASVELNADVGRRTTWNVHDRAAADRLVKRIVQNVGTSLVGQAITRPVGGGLPGPAGLGASLVGRAVHKAARLAGYHGDELPPADVEAIDVRVDASLDAAFGELADAHAGAAATVGAARDRRTQTKQVSLTLSGDASIALARALAGPQGGGSLAGGLTVTYGRDGAPLELSVVRSGVPSGTLDLRTSGGRDEGPVDVTSRLDLRQPGERALLQAVVSALRPDHAAGLPSALAALGDRLRTGARTDVTRYATQSSDYDVDGELSVAARLGGSAKVSRATSRLTGAWTRPAGGAWESRTDCLPGLAAV